MATCDIKEPRETLMGAGPCDIRYEVLKRSGKPNWWCHTHGMDSSAPDGNPLETCPGVWFEPVPDERQVDLDLEHDFVAIWGVVPPGIQIGPDMGERGKIHVHRRLTPDGPKDIDGTYDIVRLHHGDSSLVVEGKAAVAYSISELCDRAISALECRHCGGLHIDEQKFAAFPHRKHLCNSCGRNFIDSSGPSVSNPLAGAHSQLELPPAPEPLRPDRPLSLDSGTYRTVMIWPSNTAIISTMTRAEETGFHVHAWNEECTQVLDDTYSSLSIDGVDIDESEFRVLTVQKALAHGAPIQSLPCVQCGHSILDSNAGWIEPSTSHVCSACGGETKTRRKVFLNPLAEKQNYS